MAWLCVHTRCERLYFDSRRVVRVIEPVDVAGGWKPAGWPDDWAGALELSQEYGPPQTVGFGAEYWPAVRAALGLAGAAEVFTC
jgi:hypothetical protein